MASVMTLSEHVEQSVDWSQLPDGCRQRIVQLMDSATRAAWRTVGKLTRQDIHAATRKLVWCDNKVPSPTALSASLLSTLPLLYHLNCSGMGELRVIQGIPSTLRSLQLINCHSLESFMPLQHCTALEQLVLRGHFTSSACLQTLPPVMSALSSSLRRLEVRVKVPPDAAEAVVRALGPLSALEALTLGLWPSQLNGTLSQHIGLMTRLRDLDLSNVKFAAGALSSLAPAIRQLTQLQSLNLSPKHMDSNTELSEALATSPAMLTRLELHNPKLPPSGAPALFSPHSLVPVLKAHSATLTALRVHGAYLGSHRMAVLASALQGCSTLTDLDLDACKIGTDGVDELTRLLIGNKESLTSLNLSRNVLGDSAAKVLAEALPPTLTFLNISNNRMGDKGMAAFARGLGDLTQLQHLDCAGNRLREAGAAALAAALTSTAPSLTYLNISNIFTDERAALALAPALCCMTALTELNSAYNNLGPAAVSAWAPALSAMTHLGALNLAGNLLGFQGLRNLVGAMEALGGQQKWQIQFHVALLNGDALRYLEDNDTLSSVVNQLTCLGSCTVCRADLRTMPIADAVALKVLGVEIYL